MLETRRISSTIEHNAHKQVFEFPFQLHVLVSRRTTNREEYLDPCESEINLREKPQGVGSNAK